VICPKCGADITGGAESCAACGEPSPDPSAGSKIQGVTPPQVQRFVYAGLWRRAAAYVLDSFLLFIILDPLVLKPLMSRNGMSPEDLSSLYTVTSRQILALNLLLALVGWVYWAVLESSPWRATLGKKLFGLEVSDLAGRRISFARATGRHFAKNISVLMLGIGFLMIAFTEKRQGFHDMISGCLVVRKLRT